MCSTFTANCGYDNSTIILIGVVYCPKKKCSGKFCLHKKTFQYLSRSEYQCPHCAFVCHVRNIPFEDQTKSLFLSFGQGIYIFGRVQIKFKVLLEMSIILGNIVPTERNANLLTVM